MMCFIKIRAKLILLLCIVLSWGCDERSRFITSSQDGFLSLNFEIAPSSFSRISVDSDGKGRFVEGDRVGLFVRSTTTQQTRYIVLTYDGQKWMPRLKPEDIWKYGEYVNISAMYPVDDDYPESQDGFLYDYEVKLPLCQQEEQGFQLADILWSSSLFCGPSEQLQLNFSHQMARMDIDVSGLITKNVVPKVYGVKSGFMHIDGSGAYVPEGVTDIYGWFTPLVDESNPGVYSVLLFPMDSYYNSLDKKVDIKLTSPEGKEVVYSLNKQDMKRLSRGKRLTVTLNSSGNGIVDEKYANKKHWFYGIDAPFFPDGGWIDRGDVGPAKLPYQPDYGWFDANKRYEFNKVPDEYQCWAAVASNMIHWWLRVNEPYSSQYIEWYNKQHPDAPFPDCTFQPLTLDDRGKLEGGSKIFAYFTQYFGDAGEFADEGINWFFTGKLPTKPHNTGGGGGFFKDVFPTDISFDESSMSKVLFNAHIKRAIEQNMVIGYSINGHVQNIWGVEFDETGSVKYIYNVDNNYAENDLNYGGASASRILVGEDENGDVLINFDPIDKTGVKTVRFFFLGTQDGVLKQYVETHCKE